MNYSTASNSKSEEVTLEKLKEISDFLKEKFPKKEMLKSIVITKMYAPPEKYAYRVNTDDGFYILVNKSVWESWLNDFGIVAPTPVSNTFLHYMGVPVVEDEKLAHKVFFTAIEPLTETLFSDIILP